MRWHRTGLILFPTFASWLSFCWTPPTNENKCKMDLFQHVTDDESVGENVEGPFLRGRVGARTMRQNSKTINHSLYNIMYKRDATVCTWDMRIFIFVHMAHRHEKGKQDNERKNEKNGKDCFRELKKESRAKTELNQNCSKMIAAIYAPCILVQFRPFDKPTRFVLICIWPTVSSMRWEPSIDSPNNLCFKNIHLFVQRNREIEFDSLLVCLCLLLKWLPIRLKYIKLAKGN